MKTIFKIIALLIFIFLPLAVSAAELKYFEFSPDTAASVKISDKTVYQPFYPRNDFFSGFDVWITNPGSAGTASFGLRNANDNLLVSKTVSIPSVQSNWNGVLLHVNFPEPVAVQSNALYKIKIISSIQTLKFYYGNTVQLLEHNAYPVPEKLLLPATIDGIDQNFFFKIAFYENGDTISPVISNVNFVPITSNSARLEFNANEPLDYKIIFTSQATGLSQIKNWGNAYEFCNEGIKNCNAILNVKPGTKYNYQIIGRDPSANESSMTGTVETAANYQPNNPPPENSGIAPVLSNIQITHPLPNSVTINWQTDEAANSHLSISLDANGNNIVASAMDSTYELIHNLSSGNVLTPQTQYYGLLSSADPQGNTASRILSFTTPQATVSTSTSPTQTPATPPNENQTNQNQLPNQNSQTSTSSLNTSGNLPTNQGDESSLPELTVTVSPAGGGNNAVIIEWSAPLSGEPNRGYQIDILRASDYKLERRITVPAGTHSVQIEGLLPGNYYIMVYGNNSGILEKIAKATVIRIYQESTTFYKKPIFYVLIAIGAIIITLFIFYFSRLKGV